MQSSNGSMPLESQRERAFSLHERGELAAAAQLYRSILVVAPRDCEIMHALGVLELQTGRFGAALEALNAILGTRESAALHGDIGNALAGLSRFDEALIRYARAIALDATYAPAHLNQGHALRAIGRVREALESYDRAIEVRPGFVEAHLARAESLHGLGRHEAALAAAGAAIVAGARIAPAYLLQGLSLAALCRYDRALESFDLAIAVQPAAADAHINRGVMLRLLARPEESLASYATALEWVPDSVEALSNRAAALIDLKRFDAALADCDRLLSVAPERLEVVLNRAAACRGLGQFEPALQCYDRAIALDPHAVQAHCGRGEMLLELGRPGEALSSFEAAVSIEPGDPVANGNLAHVHLAMGRFETGWRLYEWRHQLPPPTRLRTFNVPLWLGAEDITGHTLMVHAEQGLGDTLQFCRYAKFAESRGIRVVLSAQKPLRRLLGGLNLALPVLGDDDPPPHVDRHCPLASLPLAFGTTVRTIPTAVPYLAVDPVRVGYWRNRLGAQGFKIGICWQGVTTHIVGREYPLSALFRLAKLPGVRLISLQKGEATEQLQALPAGMTVESLGDEFDAGPDAFLDSAAVLQSLDLVVTCDTSIAHLAGALGRPTWVALKRSADWRWMCERDDSPWYRTLRLFRQTRAGAWEDVFARMELALAVSLA